MKKVLFGLLALSSISMAAAVDLGAAPAANTNIFKTGQQGAIAITGTVTSEVPVVKYVVYASGDNGTTKNDVLALPNYVLSQDTSVIGFVSSPEKVYVKRVTGTGNSSAVANLEVGDDVSFQIELDPYYTLASEFKGWIANGQSKEFAAMKLLSRITLDAIATASGITNAVTNKYGDISTSSTAYRVPAKVVTTSTANGELTISSKSVAVEPNQMPASDIAKIETAFAGGKAISNAKILVRVD